MYYECSNQHLFEAPQRPTRCASIGCQSRILRPSDQSAASRAGSRPRTDEASDQLANAFRIGMGVALVLCPFIYMLVGGSAFDDTEPTASDAAVGAAILLGVIAGAAFIVAKVCFFIGLYRSWQLVDQIRDRNAAVSGAPKPSMAVGLMFAPFVNMYWVFRAYGGLPRALEAVAQTYHLEVRKMNQQLAFAPGVLSILASIVGAVSSSDELFSMAACVVLFGAWYVATYLFGHEMFAVTWDIRRKLTA